MAKDTKDLEVSTYDDLYLALGTMNAIERAQPIQAVHPQPVDGDAVVPLLPVIYFGTLAELGFDKTKSSADAKHHPESFVLGFDYNMLNDDGTVAVVDMLAEKPPFELMDTFDDEVKAIKYFDEDTPFTLGEFRRITEDMPDATPIGPRFFDYTPDHFPSVSIRGIGIEDIPEREIPLLAILVDQTPLGEGDEDEDLDDEDEDDDGDEEEDGN